jgi:LmbE family N-acetylglucosaminyl deacetylase
VIRRLIVAAHPDDELLGAYELLAEGEVQVLYAPVASAAAMRAEGRYDEASRLLREFRACSWTYDAHAASVWAQAIYVPDPTDDHPEHRYAQALGIKLARARGVPLYFYTIQKRAVYRTARPIHVARRVQSLFLAHYPSQREHLTDPSYFLFGGVSDNAGVRVRVTVKHASVSLVAEVPAVLRDQAEAVLNAAEAWPVENVALEIRARACEMHGRAQGVVRVERAWKGSNTVEVIEL